MYEYQDEGIAFLREQDRALLGDDPGLGKTRQLLLAAEGRTLVVAPAMLLGVWRDEIAKWRPDLDAELVPYSGLCLRQKAWNEELGKETSKVVPVLKPELKQDWDTVIADEAHYLKGRKTNWTLAFEKTRPPKLMLATGTPVPNYAEDIYMIAQMLHEPGDFRFSSYWRWAAEWFDIDTKPRFGERKVGDPLDDTDEGWERFVSANLGVHYLARTRDEVGLELPPLTEQLVEVDMVPAQRRAYKAILKEYLHVLESTGEEIVCWDAGAQAAALVKIATGLEALHPEEKGSGKLDWLKEYLQAVRQPVIVACHLRATATAVVNLVTKLGLVAVEATGALQPDARFKEAMRFQAGHGDVLVCTIDALSEGVTITRPKQLVFMEHSWRPSKNEQMMRRVHRIGQDQPVSVLHLLTRGTVDEHLRESLLAKKRDQRAIAAADRRLRNMSARDFVRVPG